MPADRERRGFAWLVVCLLLVAGTSAHAAPPVDVVSANLGPLIDRAAESPSRFAVDIAHPASPTTAGEWSTSGATSTWTYIVQIPGAVSMSFHATRALLPPSATLTVTADGTPYLYTAKEADGRELWSRIGRGDSLTFELDVPTADIDGVQLEIASLQAGFRAFGAGMRNHPHYDERAHALATTEAAAPCAENWSCDVTSTNEGPGNATVALIIGNVGQCSGVIINDVPGDGTPYVLTARHCENGDANGGNPGAAASVMVYWNAVAACGASLGSIYDPGIVTQYGAQTVVEQQDAWLIRLNQPPVVDAYYSGWDATGAAFIGGFTAHHAMGSTRQFIGWFGQAAYLTVSAASLGVQYDSTFWGTVNALGAGGPGASGAGVFDATGRFVGTIVRGIESNGMGVCPVASPPAPSASTATTFATALSGIFSSTADPVSTTGTTTLESVLDPQHTGTKVIDGQTPITVRFTPPSGTLYSGSQAEIAWHASAAARACTASGGESGDGWAGPVPTSGTKTVVSFDGGDVTYTVTCTDGQRTGSGSLTAHWNLSSTEVRLYLAGDVEYGVPFTLQWVSTVRPCTASGGTPGDGWGGALMPNGAFINTPVIENVVGTVTYTLTCGSGARAGSAQVTLNVAPPSVSIAADATTLRIGEPVTISALGVGGPCARTGGAAGDGWAGSAGSPVVVSESTPGGYTYVLTCGSGAHIATGQVSVTFVNTPPAVSIQSNAASARVGVDAVLLSWDSNVRPCQLSSNGPTTSHLQEGPLTPQGSWRVQEAVIGQYDYTVTCGSGGTAAQATMRVSWSGTPSVQMHAPSGETRGATFLVGYFSTVVPCTASGGTPGDNWTGQFGDGNVSLAVVEQTVGTHTYTITCGSGDQTVTASASVEIISDLPHVTVRAANAGQVTGAPIAIAWESNVSPCVASGGHPGDGWTGTFPSSGSLTVTETSPGVYNFSMLCGTDLLVTYGGTYVEWENVPPPTLTASKTEALVGESITLTWSSVDGSACNAIEGLSGDGWEGPHAASGSLDVREPQNDTYYFVLRCGQSAPAVVIVKIDAPPTVVPTVGLTADPTSIAAGDLVTITWTAKDAQRCLATGGSGADGWSGPVSVSGGSMSVHENISGQFTYTVTCFGTGDGSAQATANVAVSPPPAMSSPTSSTNAGGGGGGGGAMGPVDVAFFLAAALGGFLRRRRLAAQRSTFV
jgi:hypothetical protein